MLIVSDFSEIEHQIMNKNKKKVSIVIFVKFEHFCSLLKGNKTFMST